MTHRPHLIELTRAIRQAGPLGLREARKVAEALLEQYTIEKKPTEYVIQYKPRHMEWEHPWLRWSSLNSKTLQDAEARVTGLSHRNQNFQFRHIEKPVDEALAQNDEALAALKRLDNG